MKIRRLETRLLRAIFPKFLQTFCKCFILHVTTSKDVLSAVKILQNIFNGLMLVAKYSRASVITANHSVSLAHVRMTSFVASGDAITQH